MFNKIVYVVSYEYYTTKKIKQDTEVLNDNCCKNK